jgi:hypothetical protein
MAAIAHFSPTLARGVVYADEGIYVIQTDKMYQPEKAAGTHLGMWMQGPNDLQEMKTESAFPFRDVYDRMKEMSEKAHEELLKEIQNKR